MPASAQPEPAPPDADTALTHVRAVDGGGVTLLPGLIDAWVRHLPQPIQQGRRHRQRIGPTRACGEFGLPQRRISKVANNRADQGR